MIPNAILPSQLRLLAVGVALALLTALLLPAPAAADGGLTAHDVARLRNVTSAQMSPDGTRIAYTVSVPRQPMADPDGAAWTELHVTDTSGMTRPWVHGQVNVSAVRWTADGTGITFLARREGDRARSLYLVPADGGEARRLLAFETDITAYSLSPDGKQVAFLAAEPAPAERRKLREQGFSQIIFEEDRVPTRVWVATLGADEKPRALDLPGSASALEWSPAAARLAVALAPTPLVDDELMKSKIHIVDVAAGRVTARLDTPGKIGAFAWSPDGDHIAAIAAQDLHDPAAGRLWVFSSAGGPPHHDLLPGYTGDVSNFAWMNADTILYLGEEGVWTTFARVGREGSDRRTLVPTGGLILTSLSLSRDGQTAAFLCQAPEHPAEVCYSRHGDVTPRRLTNVNPWLDDIPLARQEVVKFKARDGLELEGILIRPLDERRGQRYPLLLVVHGGPEAHYRNGWLTAYSSPGQFAAARGFAVFYPNYRGSTGRGVEFSKLSQGDPAGKEFDDLVDGVDHLIEAGLVDRARVGITGGSYGGYASAWGATYYSERFAAAVMFVGISHNLSKIVTSDIPNELYLVHLRKWPWEDWQGKLERSPVYHAHKSKTPTLILHGTADTRVYPGQSLEMYRHLKLRGQAPVRLVWYPGEPHGNQRAASRLDYSLRLMQWMEHYLVGPGGDPPPYELDYAAPK